MSSQIKTLRYCKIAGHQAKRIIKICVSKQTCPNRYLCELCLKQSHQHFDQCISIDQFLQRINQIKLNYKDANKIEEMASILKNKINSCMSIIQQQFQQLEDRIEGIKGSIRNSFTNISQVLDQLSSNPLGFNDENLNRNLYYLQEESWNEFQMSINKGSHLMKQYFNILHEQTLRFKLSSGHSQQGSAAQLLQVPEVAWHLKGIDQSFEAQFQNRSDVSRFITYYSAQSQELMTTNKQQSSIRILVYERGGYYNNGLKVGEWTEIVRDNPFQYHYITHYFNNFGELQNVVDINYCDLSSDVLKILDEYEQPNFLSNSNSIAKDLSSRVFLSPKAYPIDRVRLGSYSSIGKSSRKLEKYQ
ncbi:unnamed protein product (macronuclear) [Paramecium tetraurelia]|uniref:Uncharacterized protein n=1 Tax=Paramecium tetraurelia TaxID=5888 RepID=A0CBD9_PARTE|nr:uncharacterized protein GSPATT00036889001 [Paramecium tetraurelia]CAK68106.1 unnamed protein product [Paramecium tetraurelia]|eukprot:XP_001435503.1 hypothetical protein (macronuclear) [Paramecium tetraurelia strain d4-2]